MTDTTTPAGRLAALAANRAKVAAERAALRERRRLLLASGVSADAPEVRDATTQAAELTTEIEELDGLLSMARASAVKAANRDRRFSTESRDLDRLEMRADGFERVAELLAQVGTVLDALADVPPGVIPAAAIPLVMYRRQVPMWAAHANRDAAATRAQADLARNRLAAQEAALAAVIGGRAQ